jgi:VWFA-related protein
MLECHNACMQVHPGRLGRQTLFRVACLSACVGLGLSAAQDQPPRSPFRAEANYVRVDVYPTHDGVPIADLQQEEFEILEDKVPQTIDQFEHVVIRGGGPQETRREPNTVAEARQALEDSRARVFVLFLDVNHVEGAASRTIGRPLVKALDRLIGPDDLIALMMPGMSARHITFARRTTTIEDMLSNSWWGERDRDFRDPVEQRYASCYPGIPRTIGTRSSDQGIAQEMILRRREQQTLDALEDLVMALRDVREERKAILLLSDGWRLFGPNLGLVRPIENLPPRGPTIAVDPRSGKLTTDDTKNPNAAMTSDCERDRVALAQFNGQLRLREIVNEANRSNASFYTIDPRGLVGFDEQIVPSSGVGVGPFANPTVTPAEDSSRLTARHTSLRTLAEATDGLAIIETNAFAQGLKRIVDDLSSYYLLGYYSTGKLDGKFHAISVRIKRPGVQVRSRRGYLAPTAAQARMLTTSATTPAAMPGAAAAGTHALEKAIESLDVAAREGPLQVHVAAGWTPAGSAACWVIVEVGRGAGSNDWTGGGQADVLVIDKAGATVATGRGQIAPGASSVRIALASGSLAPGDYDVRVRSKAAGASAASTDSLRLVLPASPNATSALFFRSAQSTGNKDVPTAGLRFRRIDQLRLDVPTPSAEAVSARLLDRTGKAVPIPIAASVRDDEDGSRWRTARLALAPLAPGDYIIELASGTERTLLAFRVVP